MVATILIIFLKIMHASKQISEV